MSKSKKESDYSQGLKIIKANFINTQLYRFTIREDVYEINDIIGIRDYMNQYTLRIGKVVNKYKEAVTDIEYYVYEVEIEALDFYLGNYYMVYLNNTNNDYEWHEKLMLLRFKMINLFTRYEIFLSNYDRLYVEIVDGVFNIAYVIDFDNNKTIINTITDYTSLVTWLNSRCIKYYTLAETDATDGSVIYYMATLYYLVNDTKVDIVRLDAKNNYPLIEFYRMYGGINQSQYDVPVRPGSNFYFANPVVVNMDYKYLYGTYNNLFWLFTNIRTKYSISIQTTLPLSSYNSEKETTETVSQTVTQELGSCSYNSSLYGISEYGNTTNLLRYMVLLMDKYIINNDVLN